MGNLQEVGFYLEGVLVRRISGGQSEPPT